MWVKVGFPITATAKIADYTVNTQGYFPAEDCTYDDLPQYGFGTYNCAGSKTNLDFALNVMTAAEVGVKWKIGGSKNSVCTVIYADYGLSDIQKTKNKTFVQNELTEINPQTAPVIVSQYAGKPFTDNVTLLSVGIKLRVTFGIGNTEPKNSIINIRRSQRIRID